MSSLFAPEKPASKAPAKAPGGKPGAQNKKTVSWEHERELYILRKYDIM